MRRASRARGRRGVLVAAVLLIAVVAVLDMARTDSLLRSVWRRMVTDEGAPIESILRRSGIIHRR